MKHVFLSLLLLVVPMPLFAQRSIDQQAADAVQVAKRQYQDGDLTAAREQFQNVLAKFPNQQGTAARYGIGLTHLYADPPNLAAAVESLTHAANDGGFVERGPALYQLAVAQRQLGMTDQSNANAKYEDALRRYREAAEWFTSKKQLDWAGRAHCDVGELLMRLQRSREARDQLANLLKREEFKTNPHRPLALYYHGLAAFVERDYSTASRSLNQLAPFDQPDLGSHARYLVGRLQHLANETTDAIVHYTAVVDDYSKRKAAAQERLRKPEEFAKKPAELRRLERFVASTPDHVAAASFQLAMLKYEANHFEESLKQFHVFVKEYATSPYQADAQLRIGATQVQLKQYAEAIVTLTPLIDQAPKLADQTLHWLGQAQVAQAVNVDVQKLDEREAKFNMALETLRKAADKAREMSQKEPAAKQRRGDCLLSLGDALQLAKQYRRAAETYESIWNEYLLPENRHEELIQRLATSWGAASDRNKSEQWCNEFIRRFPQGRLLPHVVYRRAENSLQYAMELAKLPDAQRREERRQRFDEAMKRYQEAIDRFPQFEQISYAHYGLMCCAMQLGRWEHALKSADAIPDADRRGDLAIANLLHAEVLTRLLPLEPDGSQSAKRMADRLNQVADLLEHFVANSPHQPEIPEAMLAWGTALRRLANLTPSAIERATRLQQAREVLDKLRQQHPKTFAATHAKIELAYVRNQQADREGAMNELRAFRSGELANTPLAPLALIQLVAMLREAKQYPDAIQLVEELRNTYERELEKQPDRAEWLALLRYHHAWTMVEAGQVKQSRPLFERVVNEMRTSPIGVDAAIRSSQANIADAQVRITKLKNEAKQAGLKPDKVRQIEQHIQQVREEIVRECDVLERRVQHFSIPPPHHTIVTKLLYESAWAFRGIADDEVEQSRQWIRQDAIARWAQELNKPRPDSTPLPPQPTIPPRSTIDLTRAEQRTIQAYQRIIHEYPDTYHATLARFEAGELYAEREKYDDAVKLLQDALDHDAHDRAASPDLLDRIRVKLGAVLLAKKEHRNAAQLFAKVARNEASVLRPLALSLHGEALIALGEYTKAVESLLPFRQNQLLQQIPGISERAVIRLAHAYASAKNWAAARETYQRFFERYPTHALAPDARYGLGWVYRQEQNFDAAVQQFEMVLGATSAEVAAKAQLEIGRCRMQQKRYVEAAREFLVVPYHYDFAELSCAAVLETAQAYAADQKPDAAIRLLTKLLADAPANSEWGKAAQELIAKLKK